MRTSRNRTPYTRKHQRGFTLVEMLVSLGIFTVVMVIAVGALLALVDANRKAQNLQLVMSNLNFALDHLSRTISTGGTYHCEDIADNDLEGGDYSLPSGTDDCAAGANGLIVTDDRGRRIGYGYRDGQLFRNVEEGGWVPITGEEVVIDDLLFYVDGSSRSDEIQPFVTIVVKGFVDGIRDTETEFDIQTSVTQRILDE